MGPVNPPVRPGVVYVTHTHRGRANVSQTQLFGGRCYLFSVACPSSSITHTFFYLLGNAHTHTRILQYNDTHWPYFLDVDGRKRCMGGRQRMRGVKPEGEGRKQLEVEKVSQPVVLL